MAIYSVGRQIPGASNAVRALESRLGSKGSLAVGMYAVGEIKTPDISWTILTQAMRTQMNAIQKKAVSNVEETVSRTGRRGQSTGRLAKATGSKKNAQLFMEGGKPVGFAVGLTGFLDSDASAVKWYWRAIEEGSRRHVGRVLYGAWGTGKPVVGGEVRTAFPPPVVATGPFGITAGPGKFLPHGWFKAANYTGRAAQYRINQEISPHRYYRDAWRDTNTPARMERAMMDWARFNGLPLKVQGIGRSSAYGSLRT